MKPTLTRLAFLVLGLGLAISAAEAKLDSKEYRELTKKIRYYAKSGDYAQVASLISELAADDSKRAVDDIAGVAASIPNADIYNASRDALASFTDAEAVEHMCKVMSRGSSKWPFRVLLADAFARRSDPETLTALNEALADKRPEVIRAVLDALTGRRDTSSIEPLIKVLEELEADGDEGLNTEKVREALEALTGKSFPKAIDWRSWWEGHKDSFRVSERPTTGGEEKKVGGTVLRRPKFFGSELKSRRIVFVIDVSGSMQATDPAPPGGVARPKTGGGDEEDDDAEAPSRVRLERAKWQLSRALKNLPDDAYFTVIAYHGAYPAPPLDGPILKDHDKMPWAKVWSPKLQKAGERSVEKAVAFVGEFKPEGGTFTWNALRLAFEVMEADNIILLSDGAPNDPTIAGTPGMGGGGGSGSYISTDEILKKVQALNAFRKMRIDTFGFDPASGMGGGSTMAMQNPYVEFLKKLAEENGGKFTPIK